MLRLIGKPYIIQHCLNVRRQEALDLSYRVYMTDVLAGLAGAEARWADVLPEFSTKPAKPQQSAGEVIARIKAGLNGGDTA